ncbi:hypothetical protein ACFWAO_34255, partial [Streptomyces sp. NPDC059981]
AHAASAHAASAHAAPVRGAGAPETPAAHAAPGAGAAVGVRPRRPVPSWARPDGPASEEAGTPAVTGTGSLAG